MTNPTEQQFYQDAGVQVTNARFITSGQTIAMSGVTAVSTHKDALPKGAGVILLLALATLIFAKGVEVKVLAVFILIPIIWLTLNPVYSLLLTSSSGNKRMLGDRKKDRIFKIAEAVNQVIIHRT